MILQLQVSSYSVAGFFDPCVDQIKESLLEQIDEHDVPVRPLRQHPNGS